MEYTISTNSDTEFSRTVFSYDEIQDVKLLLSDLKTDMQIVVYTDQDVQQGTSFTALRVEPIIEATPAATLQSP